MTDIMNTARACTEFAKPTDDIAVANPWAFFRHWLANPRKMGSVVPSSPALCRRLVAHTRCADDEVVVEIGAGTGVVSRALLSAGLPPQRLFVVEIMPGLAAHLRRVLPGANVIEGDARHLDELIPSQWHGRVGTVVCGIPLLLLSQADQRLCVRAIDAIAPGRGFLLFSYMASSPIDRRKLGLTARRVAWTPLNFPPASVWRYMPA